MTTIQFYHLTTTPLERALPKLLEKTLAGGYRTLLMAESEERVEQLNQLLWTYDPNSFLPHGSAKDGQADKQPILLSTTLDTLNNASILLVIHGLIPDQPERFERIVDMFDGNHPPAVDAARARWTHYKNADYSMSYMKQTEKGGWEQKAVA